MAGLLSEIRADLVTALGTITGTAIYPRIVDSVETPCLVVGGPEDVAFDQTMRSNKTAWVIPVRLYVGRADIEESQAALDPYLAASGSKSVRAAVNAGSGATSSWDYARCSQARGYGAYEVAGIDLLGVEFVVSVIT